MKYVQYVGPGDVRHLTAEEAEEYLGHSSGALTFYKGTPVHLKDKEAARLTVTGEWEETEAPVVQEVNPNQPPPPEPVPLNLAAMTTTEPQVVAQDEESLDDDAIDDEASSPEPSA